MRLTTLIAKYKEEIQKLQASEAEIKALSFNYAAMLKEKEHAFLKQEDGEQSPYSEWNITGTYKGRWSFEETINGSSRFLEFEKSDGLSVLELISTPTKIRGVHYNQGIIVFASVMGTLGLQVLIESGRQLITKNSWSCEN
ncbi:uncharacterized protein LOC109726332 [Ananas comosus]|uniref:Uncharacterized protein LOC109726332 n=1 Tax=Ananas comosus TaxID=4615 RepID=A0A6P5GS20_ANACO|nr:uncharacterized protein LOC109726332 [Ananas comosus]